MRNRGEQLGFSERPPQTLPFPLHPSIPEWSVPMVQQPSSAAPGQQLAVSPEQLAVLSLEAHEAAEAGVGAGGAEPSSTVEGGDGNLGAQMGRAGGTPAAGCGGGVGGGGVPLGDMEVLPPGGEAGPAQAGGGVARESHAQQAAEPRLQGQQQQQQQHPQQLLLHQEGQGQALPPPPQLPPLQRKSSRPAQQRSTAGQKQSMAGQLQRSTRSTQQLASEAGALVAALSSEVVRKLRLATEAETKVPFFHIVVAQLCI